MDVADAVKSFCENVGGEIHIYEPPGENIRRAICTTKWFEIEGYSSPTSKALITSFYGRGIVKTTGETMECTIPEWDKMFMRCVSDKNTQVIQYTGTRYLVTATGEYIDVNLSREV